MSDINLLIHELETHLYNLESQIPTKGTFAWALMQCDGDFSLIAREDSEDHIGLEHYGFVHINDLLATDWEYHG